MKTCIGIKNPSIIKEKKVNTINAKPFLKWAGGKTQLLNEIICRLPKKILETKKIDTYIEPFVGGGAVFFYLKSNFNIKKSYLIDVNEEIVLSYNVIKENPDELVQFLSKIERKYLKKDKQERKDYYYHIRNLFNKETKTLNYNKELKSRIKLTAYLLFLNKTCFNGLYRVNSKNEFNVPHGSYQNPTICNIKNIHEVSKALQNTKIIAGDFEESRKFIRKNTFMYLDPPYRPLNSTAAFTNYCKDGFNEKDQSRLADFFNKMDKKEALLLLSNSDPKNEDPKDNYFDELYKDYHRERVDAKRVINSNGNKRGIIKELIIRSYAFDN